MLFLLSSAGEFPIAHSRRQLFDTRIQATTSFLMVSGPKLWGVMKA
jgi:hypothetical protein